MEGKEDLSGNNTYRFQSLIVPAKIPPPHTDSTSSRRVCKGLLTGQHLAKWGVGGGGGDAVKKTACI